MVLGSAQAQGTPIKFQLDWRFEGPAALFLTPAAKGYFKGARLDVTIDAGNGSGGAVTRFYRSLEEPAMDLLQTIWAAWRPHFWENVRDPPAGLVHVVLPFHATGARHILIRPPAMLCSRTAPYGPV